MNLPAARREAGSATLPGRAWQPGGLPLEFGHLSPGNANGVSSSSPGLRGTSYPGCVPGSSSNSERVESRLGFHQVEAVRHSIAGQKGPHRRLSFQDEFPRRLRRYEIEFDERQVGDGCNSFRVDLASGRPPRVARSSQPWAGRWNAVGVPWRSPSHRRPSLRNPRSRRLVSH
jgi:hypothetical protein